MTLHLPMPRLLQSIGAALVKRLNLRPSLQVMQKSSYTNLLILNMDSHILLKRGIMSIRIRVSRLHLTIVEILITTTLKNSSTELTCHR